MQIRAKNVLQNSQSATKKKIATKLQAKLQTNPSKNEYCKELLRIAFESGIFYQKKNNVGRSFQFVLINIVPTSSRLKSVRVVLSAAAVKRINL